MGYSKNQKGAVQDPTQSYYGRKNFIFFSCHFPPRFRYFAHGLKQAGVNVLGIGDASYDQLHFELKGCLSEYYKVANMESYDQVYRAVGHFIHQHGRIHFFESFNEHWVELEGKIRQDFNIPGYRPDELEIYKRKSGMKQIYIGAGLDVSPGILPANLEEAREYAKKTGYPFIIKPDMGVGAVGAQKISNEEELSKHWKEDMFLEKFIYGDIETYDGIADENGEVVFQSSILYSAPIMEVLQGSCESIYYFIRKDVPEDIIIAGQKAVKAFNVKSRFFHCEFFRTRDEKKLIPLEINLRPPGGLSVDMWNFAYRQDVYEEYAKVITGRPVTPLKKASHFAIYTGRRNAWRDEYVNSHEAVLQKLGKKLELVYEVPAVFSAVMGDTSYIWVCDSMDQILEIIKFIEDRRKK